MKNSASPPAQSLFEVNTHRLCPQTIGFAELAALQETPQRVLQTHPRFILFATRVRHNMLQTLVETPLLQPCFQKASLPIGAGGCVPKTEICAGSESTDKKGARPVAYGDGEAAATQGSVPSRLTRFGVVSHLFFVFFAAELYEQGHLTDEEYSRRKNEIIDAMMVKRGVRRGGRWLTALLFLSFFSQGGGDEASSGRTTAVATNPTRSTAANPTRSTQQRSHYEEEEEEVYSQISSARGRQSCGGQWSAAHGTRRLCGR